MAALVVVLWAMYVSECFVRCRPGGWVFRRALFGRMRGTGEGDLSFLDGRFAFAWTAMLPWNLAYKFSGGELNRRRSRIAIGRVQRDSRWLRVSATALFSALMIVLPLLILTERLLPALPYFLAGFVLTWMSTFAAFLVAHHRVRGVRPALETWLVLALSPVSLIRAPFVLSMSTESWTHPVIAADLLCDDREFQRIARLWYFDSADLRPFIEKAATERGLQHALLAPPADAEAGAARFCPRCHATYAALATRCVDCEGVDLALLPVESGVGSRFSNS